MRILALVTDAYGGKGGIAQANRDLLEALGSGPGAHEVTVLPVHGERTDGPGGIRQEKAPAFGRAGYALAAAGWASRRPRFDLIFCGHTYLAPLTRNLSRVYGVRYWLHIYGIDAWSMPAKSGMRAAARNASLVTAISRHTRRLFLAWSDLPPERARIVPCTVGERFTPGVKSAALLARWGLAGKKVILTVGRLSPSEQYKGHDRIISVLPDLARRHPEARYLVAGDGGDRPRLEALASSAGVRDRVVFTGEILDEELPEVYRLADVFAMPSTGEGFGIAFLEAAACGVPVIGGHADGTVDALREGRLGALVDASRPADLTAALDAAFSGSARAPQAQEVARFSRERFAGHLARLLKDFET